jgi:bacteriorhodopsin
MTDLLRNTFMTAYLVLFGYTTITAIEAIRTPSIHVRHIMNIETAVSLVAGLVYGMFIEEMKKPDFQLSKIVPLRYLDWTITTPLILLGIVLFYNERLGSVPWMAFLGLVALDWAMLYAGYLGETKRVEFWTGLGVGFAAFAALLLVLWQLIPAGRSTAVFWIFATIWTGYGIAYMLDEETKNITYNILDIISKAIFGVVLWMYYGRVLAFD